ncbi:MAG: type II secretion system protein GspM [Brevundimonas sp.]
MSALIAKARDWFSGRSVRERRMLVVMGVALALFIAWFGVAAPILGFRADAARDLARAQADHALLSSLSGRGAANAGGRSAAEIQNIAGAAASSAGVVASFTPEENGAVRFAVTGSRTGPLFSWLADLEAAGLSVRELGVTENADATLEAEGLILN